MRSNNYMLQRESEFVASGETSFEAILKSLKDNEKSAAKKTSAAAIGKEIKDTDQEIEQLRERLYTAKRKRLQIMEQRAELAKDVWKASQLRDALQERVNELESELSKTKSQVVSIDAVIGTTVSSLDKFKQINALNDAFYIWYSGPFATINGFKLGTLLHKPVDFTEINAALGQASLCVHIIASRCGIDFKHFVLLSPMMGSCARVFKADDRRTSFPLFIDQSSFSFFPKRNFNQALLGFMHCVQELGDYVAASDPTLAVPYKIDNSTSTIGGKSFVYGAEDEVWTHALKFMLANVKWIIAWYCKHGQI
mmetsp:Transcript_10512/g.17136  ORF Transcript_10512/g.17136 Transcript_10512/m.17136 type:complete len:310 (+) Transcript_10512:102-1031(+)